MIEDSIKNRKIFTAGFHVRWLLLLIFPVGFLVTVNAYSDEWGHYLLLNIISFISAWLLLLRLRKITAENIIIWIIFIIILVAYYLKFYFFVRGFILGKNIIESIILMGGHAAFYASSPLLLDCFEIISVSICLFAITAFYMLRNKKALVVSRRKYSKKKLWNRRCYTIIFIASCLAVIFGFIRWFFKLGMPRLAVELPYKLAGITTVTSTHVVSFLLGLALIYAIRSDKTRTLRVTIISFFAWGVIHYYLFGSKLFLVLPLFWVVFIGLWEKRSLLKWKYLVGLGGLFVLLYPFLNLVRVIRRAGVDTSIFLYISDAIMSSGSSGTDSLSPLSLGLYGLMSRISGFESMLMIAAIKPEFGDVTISGILGSSAESILTNYVLGWGNRGTGIAPSLIGQAYFHTENSIMTAVMVAAWTIFSHQVAKRLYKVHSTFSQVLWVTWIASVVQWTSDGVYGAKLLFFLVAAIPVYLIIFFIERTSNYLPDRARPS